MTEPHFRDKPLEARPAQRRGSGTSKVIIDDGHLLAPPAEPTSSISKAILQAGRLSVFYYLPRRRLTDQAV